MNLEEVATFVQVVRSGSFSDAALQLGVPRSTVSRRIARLEEQLGLRLIHRTTRRMALTQEGTAYFEQVAPAVRRVEEAADLARDLGGEPRGLVRLTAPVDFSPALLADLARELGQLHPAIQLHVELTNRRVDLIQEGYDIALRAGQLADSSLVARRIDQTDAELFASPALLAGRAPPSEPAELATLPCILFRPTGPTQVWRLEHEDGREASVEVTGTLSTNEYAFLRRAALVGVGIGLMPTFLGLPDVRAGRLVRLLPAWKVSGGALHLVTHELRYLPSKVRVVRDFLLKRLLPPPWRAEDWDP